MRLAAFFRWIVPAGVVIVIGNDSFGAKSDVADDGDAPSATTDVQMSAADAMSRVSLDVVAFMCLLSPKPNGRRVRHPHDRSFLGSRIRAPAGSRPGFVSEVLTSQLRDSA